MFTVSNLTSRGWTKTLIRQFLPNHDDTKPNPKYVHAGAPMKLYLEGRVMSIESSERFLAAKEKSELRKQSAKKGVETKRSKLFAFLKTLEVSIPVYERETLIALAKKNFRSLDLPDRVEISDERMCVNYLRHCESEYERQLRKIAGKTGGPDAYYEIKEKVLTEIEETYDWLASECELQMERLNKKRFPDF